MSTIVDAVASVTHIMQEIAAASDEQSRGITQVSQAISEMDKVTQQNASLVEEASAAAVSLEEQAARLTEAVDVFRLNKQSVLAEIRGAGEPVSFARCEMLKEGSTDPFTFQNGIDFRIALIINWQPEENVASTRVSIPIGSPAPCPGTGRATSVA